MSRGDLHDLARSHHGDVLACGLIFLAAIDKLTLEEFLEKVRESIAPIEKQFVIKPTVHQINMARKKTQFRAKRQSRRSPHLILD